MLQDKKIALITGAGDGIGSAIAVELAKKNTHVIITGRCLSNLGNTESKIAKNGGSCSIVQLDMKDFMGIDRLGLQIFKRWKKLDILVSNAAVLGTLTPLHHQKSEEFIEVLNVNLISNQRLIRSLDSLLKNSQNPKAFFLSSDDANPKPFWGAYSVSKAGLNHMIKIWSKENYHNNLSICIVDPGETNTKIRKQAMPGKIFNDSHSPVTVAKSFIDLTYSETIFKGEIVKLK